MYVMQALFRPQPQCCHCEFCCSILSSVEAMMPTPIGEEVCTETRDSNVTVVGSTLVYSRK